MLEEEMERDEDEVMSSYVIENNSNQQEGTGEAVSIDEAIAWAKEKSQSLSFGRQHKNVLIDHHSDELQERPNMHDFVGHLMDGHGTRQLTKMEIELLDEDIRLWSAGRETNIRLLLSTLHPILARQWLVCNPTNKPCRKAHKSKKFIRKHTCLWTVLTMDGHGTRQLTKMEIELLDEDIRLWSAGRETNIRLLLSTLHPWLVCNPTNKPCRKAHKSKKFIRKQGYVSTLTSYNKYKRKYVAEKTFSILL
ncbi:PREDICTED: uncharacterized protein LOC105115924, partial [Populus euphratica]|uniref:Uncharacterized protein LOC105115924 n=1 Tax=Populus euphratica TaxID=75702 RepID=A0AAJ6TI28_POPEU